MILALILQYWSAVHPGSWVRVRVCGAAQGAVNLKNEGESECDSDTARLRLVLAARSQ
jgi:hypothetical protein